MRRCLIITAILLIVLMSLGLAGCGGGTKTISTGDGSIKYSENTKKSVAIPASYPAKDFPIYKEKESYVAAIQEQDKSFIVTYFTKDKMDDVVKFYEEALKGGQDISTTKDKEGLVSLGIKGTYTYSVVITESKEFEGYPTAVALSLVPGDPAMAEALKQK